MEHDMLTEPPLQPAGPTLLRPADAQDAQQMLETLGECVVPIAGGTALQLSWPEGVAPPITLVDVSHLPQSQGLRWPDGTAEPRLRIGCATTLAVLARDVALRGSLPMLAQAVDVIGAPGIRTPATLGGNLGWRHGDTVAALLALDASVELAHGKLVPLSDWVAQVRPPLAVAVHVPLDSPPGWFEKIGGREAFSPSRLTLASCGGRLAAVAGDLPGRRLLQAEQCLAQAGATRQALADALAVDLAEAGRVDTWRVTAATHLILARTAP